MPNDPDAKKVYAIEESTIVYTHGQKAQGISAYWREPWQTNTVNDDRAKVIDRRLDEASGAIESIAHAAVILRDVFRSADFQYHAPGLDGFVVEVNDNPHERGSTSRLRVVSGRSVAVIELDRTHWFRLYLMHELAHAIISQHEPNLPDHGAEWRGVFVRLLSAHVDTTVAGVMRDAFERRGLEVSIKYVTGPIVPCHSDPGSMRIMERTKAEAFQLATLNARLVNGGAPIAVIGDVAGHYYHLVNRDGWRLDPALFRSVAEAREYLAALDVTRLPGP